MLTQTRLKQVLLYDPETGIFRWRISPNRRIRVGDEAGTNRDGQYRAVRIDGVLYLAHRLAWLYVYGALPGNVIDHKNNTKTDNRIENLRDVTPSQNQWNTRVQKNSKSGTKGVFWDRRSRKWIARLTCKYKCVFNGYFNSLEEAVVAREAAVKRHHGEFGRSR